MNYYKTLNIEQSATAPEIKKAFRKLAKEHHPDAGGDEDTFKNITEAYNILSDPEKRKMVDAGIDPNQKPNDYNFHAGGFGNLHDIFSHMHGFTQRHNYRKNKSIMSQVQLTLEEVLTGKDIDAEIGLTADNAKIVSIKIPAGVDDGHQVKFRQMGDASIKDLPPGDLIIQVSVLPHAKFDRRNADLLCEHHISVWDAITGTTLPVETLDKQILNLKIKPGTLSGTIMKCAGHGLPMVNYNSHKGNLFVKIIIDIPTNLNTKQLELIEQLKESFLTANNEEIK